MKPNLIALPLLLLAVSAQSQTRLPGELVPRPPLNSTKLAGKPDVVAQLQPGAIVTRTAQGTTATTYHIYAPSTFTPAKPGPILIGFHPGGNGRAMLDALKPSAERLGWLLVGCDKLSNSLENTAQAFKIEDELLADILGSLPYDTKAIYLAGFSGGAERCYHVSARVKVPLAGILAYGGWLGGPEYQKKHFGHQMKVAIINGKNDSNANAWVAGDTSMLRKTCCRIKEFPWDGAHAIAPTAVTDQAWTGWSSSARAAPAPAFSTRPILAVSFLEMGLPVPAFRAK